MTDEGYYNEVLHEENPGLFISWTKELLEDITWSEENTFLKESNDQTDWVLFVKSTCIPYPTKFYIESEDLYVAEYRNLGVTWANIVENLKTSELLKHIMIWLIKCPDQEGSFYTLCKYLFSKVDSLSVIGNKKKQREYIDTLLRHLHPMIERYRGVISINANFNFYNLEAYCPVLAGNITFDAIVHWRIMQDLLLSYEIFWYMQKPIHTWNQLLSMINPTGRKVHGIKTDIDLLYFCSTGPRESLHSDHTEVLSLVTYKQVVQDTPHMEYNSIIYCQKGEILLLFKDMNQQKIKRMENDEDWVVIPNVGYNLKSFNEDLNLPRVMLKIIMCFLRQARQDEVFTINDIQSELHSRVIDDSWPKLSAKSKALLNGKLLNLILDLVPEIFYRTQTNIRLYHWLSDCDSSNKATDMRIITFILESQYASNDFSPSRTYEYCHKVKYVPPEVHQLSSQNQVEKFMKMYSAIFDIEPNPDFQDELAYKDIQDDISRLNNFVKLNVDDTSFENLDDITKGLEKVLEKAKKIRAEKSEQRNFEELAPAEEFADSENVIDI